MSWPREESRDNWASRPATGRVSLRLLREGEGPTTLSSVLDREVPYPYQRLRPFGRLTPRRMFTRTIENLRPYIRVAYRRPGPVLAEHIILDHELVLFRKGRGTVSFDTRTVRYGPGDVFFLRPFVPHAITADDGPDAGDHVAVHFDFAPPSFPNPDLRKPYEVRFADGLELPDHLTLTPQDGVERRFLSLLKAWELRTPLGNLEADASLLAILVALFQKTSRRADRSADTAESRLTRARLERSLAFIHQHYVREITVADMARPSGLSVSRFSCLFREWQAYSPAEYLRRYRIARAKELLADVRLSIKEIAARTGFQDPYHFSKVFHQLDGLPPSHYREILLV